MKRSKLCVECLGRGWVWRLYYGTERPLRQEPCPRCSPGSAGAAIPCRSCPPPLGFLVDETFLRDAKEVVVY
jgi:hypothetical protein